MNSQQSLFPSLAEAKRLGEEGQARVELNADDEWVDAATRMIIGFPAGHVFIAEDVRIAIDESGLLTPNAKVIGPVMQRLARKRYIARTGTIRGARTSHGSPKPEWTRLK